MEKGVAKILVENRNQRKDAENGEIYDGMCDKCCYAGRGISNYVDVLQGNAQGCTISPNLPSIY